MAPSRIIPRSYIGEFCRKLRRQKKKIVFTNGVFDLLHRGHINYLTKAKRLGDVLIVGLNSDTSVRRLKGAGRPLQSQRDRAEILLALRTVDYVVVFNEDRPDKLIEQICPDVLVKGADYKINEIAGAEFVQSNGGQVRRIRLTPGQSSSKLAEKLRRL